MDPYILLAVVWQGMVPCSPVKPIHAFSIDALEFFWVTRNRNPHFSIQTFIKTLCDLQGVRIEFNNHCFIFILNIGGLSAIYFSSIHHHTWPIPANLAVCAAYDINYDPLCWPPLAFEECMSHVHIYSTRWARAEIFFTLHDGRKWLFEACHVTSRRCRWSRRSRWSQHSVS